MFDKINTVKNDKVKDSYKFLATSFGVFWCTLWIMIVWFAYIIIFHKYTFVTGIFTVLFVLFFAVAALAQLVIKSVVFGAIRLNQVEEELDE